ncbi:hypothetical protein BLNAU_24521 [Blattamonas nauphoetae]|uniref:Right handed beta helix domain-containing protein n=1 Tax=Blattamonas nauphoetae TaxID=2049346 RepID=A0ABQ9WM79_9EUKA|nr:hypothetical protein BLNAU_24521 [Blattamonas nauphoetae]
MLSLVFFCFIQTAEIALEPLVRACNSSVLKLPGGMYNGQNIDTPHSESIPFMVSGERNSTVTLKSSSETSPLFFLVRGNLGLVQLSIIAPQSSCLILSVAQTVSLWRVHHVYTQLNFPLVELSDCLGQLIDCTFTPGSRFSSSLFLFSENRTDDRHNVMSVQNSTISDITMTAAVPFIASGPVFRVEDFLNTYERIKFASNLTRSVYSADVKIAAPHRASMSHTTFKECDGPLNGGIFFYLQCVEVTLTEINVEKCTNAVPGLFYDPSETCEIKITQSTFTRCTTPSTSPNGSALFINHAASLTLERVTFSNNTASHSGGALYVSDKCQSLNLSSSYFHFNRASFGGAVGVGWFPTINKRYFRFSSCQFANVGRSGSDIVFDDLSGLNITQLTFMGCKSRSASPRVIDSKSRKGYDWTNSEI